MTGERYARRSDCLAAQAELFDQRLVARFILALEVIKQAAALGDESEKTTTGVVVLLVALEVLGQIADTFREDCNLNFRRAGVALGGCEFCQQFRFTLCGNRHRVFPLYVSGNRSPSARMSSSRG